MAVPTVIGDVNVSAGSNSPSGGESVGTNMDNYIRAHAAFIAQLRDGSKNLEAGTATAPSMAFVSDTNNGIYSPGADRFAVATAGVKRVEIDAAGQVGVGLTPSGVVSTARSLELGFAAHGVVGHAAATTYVNSGIYNDGSLWKYGISSAVVGLYYQSAGAHSWYSAPSGTAGNTATIATLLSLSATTGNLVATGNVTAFSDERLKENFTPCEVSVSELASLDISEFDRTDTGERQCGVTAQALQKVMPLAVQENDNGMLSVDYGRAALIAAITIAKELERRDAIAC